MESPVSIDRGTARKRFLILLLILISFVFAAMIQQFVMTVLLAAIFSGLAHPLYRRLLRWFKDRAGLASGTTLAVVFLVVVIPLSIFLGIVAAEALTVSQAVRPEVEELLREPSALDQWVDQIPMLESIKPYQDQIIRKLGDVTQRLGRFLIDSVATATAGTALFLFHLFVMLYAMYFFLIYGRTILDQILYYMPLSGADKELMLGKFVSVSRAAVKGTLVIGVVQGGLAGIAFAVVGIKGAFFWGTVMMVLSIIPAVGTALVWIPAVIYLLATGQVGVGIGLAIWCGGVVGTADNFLRPRLIGKDTKMPDLLVLLSTLGGLSLFGAVGIIIGPIVAALFITVWEMYGTSFKDVLTDPSADHAVAPVAVPVPTEKADPTTEFKAE